MVIKRIEPLSAAKTAGVIYSLIGLPFAIVVWVISLVGLNESGLNGSPFLPIAPGYIIAGGAVAVLVVPIVYGCFCFVATFIGVSVYNLVARHTGGISVQVQMDASPDSPR
jgi:hypothetical protein